jgi:hypothetical protein
MRWLTDLRQDQQEMSDVVLRFAGIVHSSRGSVDEPVCLLPLLLYFPRTDARVESKLALTSWSEDRPSYTWRQWGDFAILV